MSAKKRKPKNDYTEALWAKLYRPMIEKEYELLKDDYIEISGVKLYRIRALVDFNDVKKGDLGGYVQGEENLSHEGNAWIYDNAKVYGGAKVQDNGLVLDNAEVYNNAIIFDNAKVYGNALVYDNAVIFDDAKVYGNARVYDEARVFDEAEVYGDVKVHGDETRVFMEAKVHGNAEVYDQAEVYGNAEVYDNALVHSKGEIYGSAAKYLIGVKAEISLINEDEIINLDVPEKALVYQIEKVELIKETVQRVCGGIKDETETLKAKIFLSASVDEELLEEVKNKQELDDLLTL